MHVHAYDLALCLLIPCVSASRVRDRVHAVGEKGRDAEIFVPLRLDRLRRHVPKPVRTTLATTLPGFQPLAEGLQMTESPRTDKPARTRMVAPKMIDGLMNIFGGGRQSEPPTSIVYPSFFERLPSMVGKTVVVTGASRGLGFVTALSLAKKGARVVLLSRKTAQAEKSLEEIAAAAVGPPPVAVDIDLLDFGSVRKAAAAIREIVAASGLDVLCLNAGVMLQPDTASCDGYDTTISTNVLSHFLLTRELMPELEKASAQRGEARVVSMSSGSGFGPPAFDARFYAREGGRLGGQQASYERYHQSKLANLLFTSALHEKLTARDSCIKALACTPGVCGTDMYVHVQQLSRPGMPVDLSRVASVEDGACAQLLCICDPTVRSGQLWSPRGMGGPPSEIALAPPTVLVDKESKEALWRCCEEAVGPFVPN